MLTFVSWNCSTAEIGLLSMFSFPVPRRKYPTSSPDNLHPMRLARAVHQAVLALGTAGRKIDTRPDSVINPEQGILGANRDSAVGMRHKVPAATMKYHIN
jgi:hypothetical protein